MKKSLLNEILRAGTKVGKIRYRISHYGWEWIEKKEIPIEKGVYFLVSKTGIEKVGSARGKKGLKGRLSQYTLKHKTLKKDHTNIKWHEIMTNDMVDETIDVYCISIQDFDHQIVTPIGNVDIKMCGVLEAEEFFFYKAKKELEPMRLSGNCP